MWVSYQQQFTNLIESNNQLTINMQSIKLVILSFFLLFDKKNTSQYMKVCISMGV